MGNTERVHRSPASEPQPVEDLGIQKRSYTMQWFGCHGCFKWIFFQGFESTENESQTSMSRILAERRLEWRTLIAKVDTMVNQYNEIPSLLETFDKKYDFPKF